MDTDNIVHRARIRSWSRYQRCAKCGNAGFDWTPRPTEDRAKSPLRFRCRGCGMVGFVHQHIIQDTMEKALAALASNTRPN